MQNTVSTHEESHQRTLQPQHAANVTSLVLYYSQCSYTILYEVYPSNSQKIAARFNPGTIQNCEVYCHTFRRNASLTPAMCRTMCPSTYQSLTDPDMSPSNNILYMHYVYVHTCSIYIYSYWSS